MNKVFLTLKGQKLVIAITEQDKVKTSTGFRESWTLEIWLRENRKDDVIIFSDLFNSQGQAANYLYQWLYCNQ